MPLASAAIASSCVGGLVVGGEQVGVGGAGGGGLVEAAGHVEPGLVRRGDRGGRGPAHAEVALDGAGDRGGGHHLAGQAVLGERVVGVGLDDRVHVGGRPADVDDDHVAGTGEPVDAAGQQLDPGEHHVRASRRAPSR